MKPAINMGDIIITGPFDGEAKPRMIVTYELGKELVTHRVLSVDGDALVTMGDAMEEPDPRTVNISQVKGVYLFKVPYIGYLSSFMRTRQGWFLVVILPAMVLVSFLVKDIVREALQSEPENASSKARRIARRIAQHGTDWYGPWRYRKPITIGSNWGTQTDFKAKVTINTQWLISSDKMQPDGGDIRFTEADNVTDIPYWIGSGINTKSTIIWVRIPFIPNGGTTIYLYYGNPDAAPASDRAVISVSRDNFKEQAVGEALKVGA